MDGRASKAIQALVLVADDVDADVQSRIDGLLRGCDLIGYNLKCFTIPFLAAEFERAGARMCFRDCNLIEM